MNFTELDTALNQHRLDAFLDSLLSVKAQLVIQYAWRQRGAR